MTDDLEIEGLVSVYDGRDCIGRIRPGKAGGFIAISETGIELGVFPKAEVAARAVFDARRSGIASVGRKTIEAGAET